MRERDASFRARWKGRVRRKRMVLLLVDLALACLWGAGLSIGFIVGIHGHWQGWLIVAASLAIALRVILPFFSGLLRGESCEESV